MKLYLVIVIQKDTSSIYKVNNFEFMDDAEKNAKLWNSPFFNASPSSFIAYIHEITLYR